MNLPRERGREREREDKTLVKNASPFSFFYQIEFTHIQVLSSIIILIFTSIDLMLIFFAVWSVNLTPRAPDLIFMPIVSIHVAELSSWLWWIRQSRGMMPLTFICNAQQLKEPSLILFFFPDFFKRSEIVVSKESWYFSHIPCKILQFKYVLFWR